MSIKANQAEAKHLNRAERIIQVLDHLGIERAHFAADLTPDWSELVACYPQRIASLTLMFPDPIALDNLRKIASRLMIIYGDQPPDGEPIAQALARLPGSRHIILKGSSNLSWDDPMPKYVDEIAPPLLDFLDSVPGDIPSIERERSVAETGEVAGVPYLSQGCGQPLVMLPLGFAPSQWDDLLPALQRRYRTLLLTGPELGFLPLIERRGRTAGYRRLVQHMWSEMQPREGESVLDVGCGTAVIDTWLAGYTAGRNPIVAVDYNPYFLREATARVRKEGFASVIQLREGNAMALSFEDNSFDLVISTTVMEEVDANAMLSELIRVTKPQGRIGVIVRALDVLFPTGVQVRPELKTKTEAPRGSIGKLGCASADLYRRFKQSGLTHLHTLPDWTVFNDGRGAMEEMLMNSIVAGLTSEEAAEWREAAERAIQDGTFYLTWPHHCAVGTKAA